MPPHLSYLLQPLNVSCFTTLKRLYGVTEPCSKNYNGSYYWARCVGNASIKVNKVIITSGVVA